MLKAMKEIFKYIGLLFLSMLIVSVVALIFTSTPPTALLYMGSAFLFMVFALISLKRKKVNILELCSFHKITIKDIIFSVLLAISFLFVYGGISGLTGIDNLIPDGNDYYNKYQKMKNNGIISMSISIALVAPFFEEFIFRGLIFGGNAKKQIKYFCSDCCSSIAVWFNSFKFISRYICIFHWNFFSTCIILDRFNLEFNCDAFYS